MSREIWHQGSDGRGPVPEQIDPTNYADQQDVLDRVDSAVTKLIEPVRQQRQMIELIWDRYYKVWAAKHEYRLYEGRSDLYFPIARKIIETQVGNLKGQVFPSNGSFWAEPDDADMEIDPQGTQDSVKRISTLISFDVAQAKVNRWLDLFLRQGLMYGCSPVKIFWKSHQSTNYKRRMKSPQELQDSAIAGDQEKTVVGPSVVTLYEGPTFKVVNLLDWYVYPITSMDIDDAEMVFEDIIVDWQHLQAMKEEGLYLNVDELEEVDTLRPAHGNQSETHKNIRLQSLGITVNQVKPEKPTQWKLTEVYVKFDLYGNGTMVPCLIVLCNDIVLSVRQNPFFHQVPPYLTWRVIDVQDQFYGQGLVESIEHHQYALNAMLNQTLDAVIFQTNHIVVVNTSLLAQAPETIRIAPRAIWKTMAKPDEVFSIIRPPDNSQAAFNTANLIAGSMQDTAGTPPVMQGKLPNKDATATEIAAVSQGAQTGQSSHVDNIEYSVMSPMLDMFYKLEVQFRPLDQLVKIAGQPAIALASQDVTLDYHFRWMTGKNVPPMVAAMQQQADAAKGAAGPPMGGQPMQGPGGATPAMGSPGAGPEIGNGSML